MKAFIVVSALLAVSTAVPYPQQSDSMPVVRPNHFVQPGTFQREQHLLPESFYMNGDQVQFDSKGLTVPVSPGKAQQEEQPVPLKPGSIPESAAPAPATATSNSNSQPTGSSNIPESPDSYTNIGGASGRVASSLTNVHEYGEVVPKAFSNVEHDTYAYYHGHRAN